MSETLSFKTYLSFFLWFNFIAVRRDASCWTNRKAPSSLPESISRMKGPVFGGASASIIVNLSTVYPKGLPSCMKEKCIL